jgi:hypothetical protein
LIAPVWHGEIFADRDVAWMLLVGGTVVAQRDSVIGIYRGDSEAQFAENRLSPKPLKNLRVKKGDKVEFRVIAKTYYGHFVGVDAKIVLTTQHQSKPERPPLAPRAARHVSSSMRR